MYFLSTYSISIGLGNVAKSNHAWTLPWDRVSYWTRNWTFLLRLASQWGSQKLLVSVLHRWDHRHVLTCLIFFFNVSARDLNSSSCLYRKYSYLLSHLSNLRKAILYCEPFSASVQFPVSLCLWCFIKIFT